MDADAPPPRSPEPGSPEPGLPETRRPAPRRSGPEHAGDPVVQAFRVVALVEAVSYLCLLAASIARRTTEGLDLVPIVGPIHGVIFLGYLALALAARERLGWHLRTTLVVVVAAVVPLGGLAVERRIARAELT